MTNVLENFVPNSVPAGEIRVEGATITAEVTFHDGEVAEILRQFPEGRRVESFVRGVRGGLIVMGNDMTNRMREAIRFMQTTLDTQVASFGDRMLEKVAEQLGDADKDGHVQRRVQELLARASVDLQTSIEKALPEAFEGQTKKSIERIDAEGERVLRQITALFSEEGIAWNLVHEVRRDFADRLEELKIAMTVAQTKAANPTPRDAGLHYEAWVHEQLATIATLRGDDVESTGNTAGKITRCMKGDTRIVLGAGGLDVTAPPCIAVEIRDREDSEFTLSDVETMMQNRGAHAGVVVAAHAGSLPKQYADRSFSVSRRKRLVTLVIDPDSPESEVLLAATYDVSAALAIESVRRSRDGDWDEVIRKVEAIEQAVEGTAEARQALGQIEKKARDAGSAADKRNALLVRLVAELAAVVRTH